MSERDGDDGQLDQETGGLSAEHSYSVSGGIIIFCYLYNSSVSSCQSCISWSPTGLRAHQILLNPPT